MPERGEILDRLGVATSLACGLHCVLAPLAVGVLAAGPSAWLLSQTSEGVVLAVTLAIGVASLIPAYRNAHGRKRCLGLFAAGGVTLLAAKFLLHGQSAEPWLLGAGAVMIASAHLANLHFCRSCRDCCSA